MCKKWVGGKSFLVEQEKERLSKAKEYLTRNMHHDARIKKARTEEMSQIREKPGGNWKEKGKKEGGYPGNHAGIVSKPVFKREKNREKE